MCVPLARIVQMHITSMAAAAAPAASTATAFAAAAASSTAENEGGGKFGKLRQFSIPGGRVTFQQGRKIPPPLAASVSVCCPPQEKHGNSTSSGGGGSPWSSPTSSSSSSTFSAPRVRSAFRPAMQNAMEDEDDSEKVKPPTPAALAIAAAAGASVSSAPLGFLAKSNFPGQQLLSPPSAEFLALCAEQLSLCEKIVGRDTKLTVYVRTAESYATGRLEFFLAAISPEGPSWRDVGAYKEVLLLTDKSESQRWIGLVESVLVQRESVELPELGTLVLPLVKDVFLVGFLIIERTPTIKPTMRPKQIPRLKPVRPSWPPKEARRLLPPSDNAEPHPLDNTKNVIVKKVEQVHNPVSGGFTKDQRAEAASIARTVALACMMDQRSVLLQQSAWQKGTHVDNLVDQVRGPLMAVRTLGKMLLPQLKRGEISRDVVEGILIQGDRMNEVVQQIEKTDAGSQQYHYNLLQPEMNGRASLSDSDSSLNELRRLPADAASLEIEDGLSQDDSGTRQRTSSSLTVDSNHESPTSTIAFAMSPQDQMSLCNVSETLYQLVRAGSSLAEQKGQDLQLKSHSADDIPLMAAIDETSLRQALSNLLEYSIHHTPTGGWISAEATGAPGGGVLVVIEDNGPDMGLMVQERLLGSLGSSFAGSKHGSRSNEQRAFEAGRRLIAAREILEPWGAVLHIRSPFLVDAPVGAGGTHMEIWLPIGISDDSAAAVQLDAQESSSSS